MTVASTTNRVDFIGSGITGPYSYPFRIFAATNLTLTTLDLTGLQTTLNYPADYSVSGVGNSSGGSITLTVALVTGWGLSIQRVMPLTQNTSLRNQGPYLSSTVEDTFDTAMMIDQQQEGEIARSIKAPPTEASVTAMPSATLRANKFLAFDGTGQPVATAVAINTGVATVSVFMAAVINQTTAALAQAAFGISTFVRTLLSSATALAFRGLIGVQLTVIDYGAIGDGVANDGPALATRNTQVGVTGGMTFPAGTFSITTNLTLSCALVFLPGAVLKPAAGVAITITGNVLAPAVKLFDLSLGGTVTLQQTVCPEWFGATRDGVTNDYAAFASAAASLARGGVIQCQSGTYILNTTFAIVTDGIKVRGVGGATAAALPPTMLDFSGTASGSDGITAIGSNVSATMKSIELKDLYIRMTGVRAGGAAVKAYNCGGLLFEDLYVDATTVGATGYGIQLSDISGAGANSVIASRLENCIVGCNGTPFLIGSGCTSVTAANCYALQATATLAGFRFYSCNYCSATSCAADLGAGYGYLADASQGITLTSCGAESGGKGFLKVTNGAVGTTAIGCRGVSNNTSADGTIGSFLEVSAVGVNYQTTLIGCVETTPNAATTWSIHGSTGTVSTIIIGYNATSYPKGIGGDATWLAKYVALLGGAVPGQSVSSLGSLVLTDNAAAFTAVGADDIMIGHEHQNVIGANGAASALTANPLGYLVGYRGATRVIFPYYNG